MKRILTALLSVLLGLTPTLGYGQFAVFDGGNFAENVRQTIAQIEQVYNTAQQLEYTVRQVEMMHRNLQRLSVEDWRSLRNTFYTLQGTYYQAKYIGMRWERIADQYDRMYGDYDPKIHDGKTYQQRRKMWAAQTDDSIRQAMQSHGAVESAQARDIALTKMLQESQDAAGILAAVQAGNEISGLISRQIAELTQIIVADSRARLSYLKEQHAAEEASRKQRSHTLMRGYADEAVPTDGNDAAPRFK